MCYHGDVLSILFFRWLCLTPSYDTPSLSIVDIPGVNCQQTRVFWQVFLGRTRTHKTSPVPLDSAACHNNCTDKSLAVCISNNVISGDQQIKPRQMDVSKQNNHYNIYCVNRYCVNRQSMQLSQAGVALDYRECTCNRPTCKVAFYFQKFTHLPLPILALHLRHIYYKSCLSLEYRNSYNRLHIYLCGILYFAWHGQDKGTNGC